MAMVAIQHQVEDYAAWRKVYDEAMDGGWRREFAVASDHVYRDKDDPDNLIVILTYATMAEAEASVANPELRIVMGRAGVSSEPRIEFFEEA